jgi:molybdopterin converting factor small subunit
MTFSVNFLAKLRDVMGVAKLEVDIQGQVSVQKLLSSLSEDYPQISPYLGSVIVVVNQEFASPDQLLLSEDKIMFIPPVSGG